MTDEARVVLPRAIFEEGVYGKVKIDMLFSLRRHNGSSGPEKTVFGRRYWRVVAVDDQTVEAVRQDGA